MADPALNIPRMSAKEYLELERMSPSRHEFMGGVAFAMSGASRRHNDIALDMRGLFKGKLVAPCKPYAIDVKAEVRTAEGLNYFYPDVVVTCSDLDNDPYFIRQPILIVEIMSESTRNFDRGEKFAAYRSLPSLQEYLLVEQDIQRVELFRRRTGWQPEQHNGTDQIALESVRLTLPVSSFY